jgi:hypothetical protein
VRALPCTARRWALRDFLLERRLTSTVVMIRQSRIRYDFLNHFEQYMAPLSPPSAQPQPLVQALRSRRGFIQRRSRAGHRDAA